MVWSIKIAETSCDYQISHEWRSCREANRPADPLILIWFWGSVWNDAITCVSVISSKKCLFSSTRVMSVSNVFGWSHRRYICRLITDCPLHKHYKYYVMTSRHENAFTITGLCEGNTPISCRFPSQRPSDKARWCFLCSSPEKGVKTVHYG